MSKDQHKRLHAVMQRSCLHAQHRVNGLLSMVRVNRASRLIKAFLHAVVTS
jgi:hypothetical protein